MSFREPYPCEEPFRLTDHLGDYRAAVVQVRENGSVLLVRGPKRFAC